MCLIIPGKGPQISQEPRAFLSNKLGSLFDLGKTALGPCKPNCFGRERECVHKCACVSVCVCECGHEYAHE